MLLFESLAMVPGFFSYWRMIINADRNETDSGNLFSALLSPTSHSIKRFNSHPMLRKFVENSFENSNSVDWNTTGLTTSCPACIALVQVEDVRRRVITSHFWVDRWMRTNQTVARLVRFTFSVYRNVIWFNWTSWQFNNVLSNYHLLPFDWTG